MHFLANYIFAIDLTIKELGKFAMHAALSAAFLHNTPQNALFLMLIIPSLCPACTTLQSLR